MSALCTLHPVRMDDRDELFAFESEHRAFFEARINARPQSFYSLEGVERALATALLEAQLDQGYQFLIRDAQQRLVGRINLARVRRAHFHSAELGYRIGEPFNGQGFAKAALGLMLDHAFGPLKLWRLEAVVSSSNPASAAVLRRHGFEPFGCSRRSFHLGGVWHDKLCFERHAPTSPV